MSLGLHYIYVTHGLVYFCLMTVLWSAVAAARALHYIYVMRVGGGLHYIYVMHLADDRSLGGSSIVTKKGFYVMHLGTVVTYTPRWNPHEIDIGECYAVLKLRVGKNFSV